MRSFEIPAAGGFMLAEDTDEHREFFGAEGNLVLYFKTALEAAEKSAHILTRPEERSQMSKALHRFVVTGGHSYEDRLKAVFASCHL